VGARRGGVGCEKRGELGYALRERGVPPKGGKVEVKRERTGREKRSGADLGVVRSRDGECLRKRTGQDGGEYLILKGRQAGGRGHSIRRS